MNLNDLITQTSEWLKGTGAHSDIVISSRIRLARNLIGATFNSRASEEKRNEIISLLRPVIKSTDSLRNSLWIDIDKLSRLDLQFLIERHLISHELAGGEGARAAIISEMETISLMINEEDHLRLQTIQSGLALMDAWRIVNKVEGELADRIGFAFSQEFGYLTACPTNVGTGMRASVMLHLPSLVITRQIEKISQAVAKIGFVVRGFYGEGTEPIGDYFQISNQVTLGQSEEEIISNIEQIIHQIIGHEENARQFLLTRRKKQIEDRVFRAYGTLAYARRIDSNEAIKLLSTLRLGIELDFIKNLDHHILNELLIAIQPAHLQKLNGKALTAVERDIKRAELIRKKIKK
ncbi:protein arginine kinase [candidate division NPL-UPA2 bacterium Unc8]|uniref:Protein-arginine kinase n=1 Tax=candidate division NPL-UPA2 bacterium Unc8 TaxID=1980939 RepID=A0A399FX28_UNCN2|nr:Protein-arginine kinase [Bacillota bacterium]RII00978.1 MAG: protein arginine kinase [candidate division NPL-UPA2 bacterium Unc8]